MLIGDSTTLCKREFGLCRCFVCRELEIQSERLRRVRARHRLQVILSNKALRAAAEGSEPFVVGVEDPSALNDYSPFLSQFVSDVRDLGCVAESATFPREIRNKRREQGAVSKLLMAGVMVGLPLVFLSQLVILGGCSRSKSVERTTVYEETTEAGVGARGGYGHSYETPVTTTTVKTTEEKEYTSDTSDGCGGVLSCGVDAVGAIIAFPFKVLGAVIGAIF